MRIALLQVVLCVVLATSALSATVKESPTDFTRTVTTDMKECLTGLNANKPTKGQRTKCEATAKENFKKLGGDPKKFASLKNEGGMKDAVDAMISCTKDQTGATFDQRKACHVQAKGAYELVTGNTDDYQRHAKDGARSEMMSQMESCVDDEMAGLGGGEPTQTELDTAREGCNGHAKKTFKEAGGEDDEFEAEKIKGISERVGDELDACDSVNEMACQDQVKTLVKKLGGKKAKFNRIKQDAVRGKISSFIEQCRKNAAGDADSKKACVVDGKAEFVKLSGKSGTDAETEKDFKRQVRKGAGETGAKSKKACLQAAIFEPETQTTPEGKAAYVDFCDTAAMESHANAGGDVKSYWYDTKKAMLREVVNNFQACRELVSETDATCSAKSKDYFKTTLKGDMGDFSDEDFERMKENMNNVVTAEPSNKVDLRFRFPKTDFALDAVTNAKTDIEEQIKDTTGASTVDCHPPTQSGTPVDIVCRVEVENADAASDLETSATANSDLFNKGASAIAKIQQRALRRALAEDGSVPLDATQVQIDTPVECTGHAGCDEGDECVFDSVTGNRRRLLFSTEDRNVNEGNEERVERGTCQFMPIE